MENYFLFSIDIEDVRLSVDNGIKYKDRVAVNTQNYLKWLQKSNRKATFFVVGNIAKNYPALISEIIDEGHEIACHTNEHIPLNLQDATLFRDDLTKNIEHLKTAGANNIIGFRAPMFSVTKDTEWAYEVLMELGFKYSSSVLPANNPIFGWKAFGQQIKKVNSQIMEMPMTVNTIGFLSTPIGGGIYFRTLPKWLIKFYFKKNSQKNIPVLGYFHPYDIDEKQERFMHGGINNNKIYNKLMYYNRKSVFDKLDMILEEGYSIITYKDYLITEHNHGI